MNENRRLPSDEKEGADDPRSVTLSGQDLDDAVRLLHNLAKQDNATKAQASGLTTRLELIKRAHRELAERRRRIGIFGNAMFGETGWEILLALYTEHNSARQTIARVQESVGAAHSTTLRWLDYLATHRLIRRDQHPTDSRAVIIELTEKAMMALDSYLSGAQTSKE